MFACSLDQVGLAEMKVCAEKTGGMVVLAESFANTVFKTSFTRMFSYEGEDALGVSSGGLFGVITSRDVRVAGCVGPCAALDKKTLPGAVAETSIGEYFPITTFRLPECPYETDTFFFIVSGSGGTTAWKLCSLTNDTSLAVYFEVANSGGKEGSAGTVPPAQQQQQFFLQFVTMATTHSGETKLRVTTTTRRWTDGGNVNDVAAGFDQEAGATLVARQLTWKMETEEEFDCPAATRWLDRRYVLGLSQILPQRLPPLRDYSLCTTYITNALWRPDYSDCLRIHVTKYTHTRRLATDALFSPSQV